MNPDIEKGSASPYDGREPKDDAQRTALGVLANLLDRPEIGAALESVDAAARIILVESISQIILEGMMSTTRQPYAWEVRGDTGDSFTISKNLLYAEEFARRVNGRTRALYTQPE